MSDRPAPPSQPPAPPRTPTQARPRPILPPPARPEGAPGAASPSGAAAAPATETGPGDTAVRVGLAERIQAKLAAAGGSGDPRGETATGAATAARKPRARGPRRARLRLTRIDPWSVMKTAFLLSIALGVVTVVAVAMIWEVIGAAGVWDSINDIVKEVIDEPGTANFDVEDYVGTDRVVGFSMLVAAVNVVLITAIATLAAFLYNMSAALLGGIEVTLAEDA